MNLCIYLIKIYYFSLIFPYKNKNWNYVGLIKPKLNNSQFQGISTLAVTKYYIEKFFNTIMNFIIILNIYISLKNIILLYINIGIFWLNCSKLTIKLCNFFILLHIHSSERLKIAQEQIKFMLFICSINYLHLKINNNF